MGAFARGAALVFTVALGLATRKASWLFPGLIATYGGDTLYATMWVQIIHGIAEVRWRRGPARALRVRQSPIPARGSPSAGIGGLPVAPAVGVGRRPIARGAAAGFAACALIEASQAIRVDWLDALRATTAGGLVLGRGFLWSDLVCYAVGAVLGAGMERLQRERG